MTYNTSEGVPHFRITNKTILQGQCTSVLWWRRLNPHWHLLATSSGSRRKWRSYKRFHIHVLSKEITIAFTNNRTLCTVITELIRVELVRVGLCGECDRVILRVITEWYPPQAHTLTGSARRKLLSLLATACILISNLFCPFHLIYGVVIIRRGSLLLCIYSSATCICFLKKELMNWTAASHCPTSLVTQNWHLKVFLW